MKEITAFFGQKYIRLFIGAAGIYFSYLNISIICQKIYSHRYPRIQDSQNFDFFQHAQLTQAISSFFCLVYAFSYSSFAKQGKCKIPIKQILLLGLLFTINVNTLNYALYYVPYPIKVVGDKLGYLSSVIIGVFFTRVLTNNQGSLNCKHLIRAFIISAGILSFFWFYEYETDQMDVYQPSQRWKGFLFITISVIFQALFTDSQAYCKITFKPSSNQMMLVVSFMTMIFNIGLLLVRQTLWESIKFVTSHQQIGLDIFKLGVLTIIGQVSIYYVIINFKQHVFPLISTTRKILSIIYSIYYFDHQTNIYMWISLSIVFGGIMYELIQQISQKKQQQKDKENPQKIDSFNKKIK